LGRSRSDMFEIAVWKESINVVNGNELFYVQAIHQESDVVPENIDAIRAMTGIEKDAKESMKKTDESMRLKIWW
ncbi:MAG: glyceraldehyde-3-phosphate dehydrogenase, partial [Candidatus Aenigmarchaeota archaeon]|nr:glyceraldehyde-3-phosphate dehydrogenase [Candidatus Aenigmarchaeota archaeon]